MKEQIIKTIIATSKKATASHLPQDTLALTQAVLNSISALSLLATMEQFSNIKME